MVGLQPLFAATHNRRVDNAVSDHLDRAVEGHQAGGAGRGDRVGRALESVSVADIPTGRAIKPTQQGGVVYPETARLDFLPDRRFLIRRHRDDILHGPNNMVGMHVKDQVCDRVGRLPRVLGNEHADAIHRDAGIEKCRIPYDLFSKPEGQFGGIGHGTEILGRNVQFLAGDIDILKSTHIAVGLALDTGIGIIVQVVVPPGTGHLGDPAPHGQGGVPDFLWGVTQ